MKKLARMPSLYYTAYGLFCLFASVSAAAWAGFIYALKHGFFDYPAAVPVMEFDTFAYEMRYGFGIIAVSCTSVAVFLLIVVIFGAGHKDGHPEHTLRRVDKIPYEAAALMWLGMAAAIVRVCFLVLENIGLWNMFIVCPALLVVSLLIEQFVMTTAIRYKTATLSRNTLLNRFYTMLREMFMNFGMTWKVTTVLLFYFALTFITMYYDYLPLVIVWAVVSFIILAAICATLVFMHTLEKGVSKIADGNLGYKVNTTGMFTELRKFGDKLNSINIGMSKAVEEKTRSDRLRTELITNVSHDIKTPLTSIINYVDLLKRDNLTETQRREYIEVLERQSSRLKKLVVDLVEASKAVTGNVSVSLVPTNLTELLNQALAEYSDKIAAAGLELHTKLTDESMTANADGKLVWRIFDNLLSNICKYSLSGTRVYIDSENKGADLIVSFKNISASVLNIPSDELTERFVRGDISRSTEGSGLGLSITQSLAELQGGKLIVFVDGDLFKTTVIFKAYSAPDNSQ